MRVRVNMDQEWDPEYGCAGCPASDHYASWPCMLTSDEVEEEHDDADWSLYDDKAPDWCPLRSGPKVTHAERQVARVRASLWSLHLIDPRAAEIVRAALEAE